MAIAEGPGDFPLPILIAPDHSEVSHAIARTARKLAEAVRALRDSAKSLDGIDLKRIRQQFPTEISANVLASASNHVVPGPGDAAVVMVKHFVSFGCAGQ